jgi:Macrocin-O-methyltransferase (TylF)
MSHNRTTSHEETLSSMGLHANRHVPREKEVIDALCAAFTDSAVPLHARLQSFPRHTRRQDIARFLSRYELFKLSAGSHGSLVECGVFTGGGLLGWLHFSAILEPYNHSRRIIGFDTFAGFPAVTDEDTKGGTSVNLHTGAYTASPGIREEIQNFANLHDQNRPLGHIPKVELVAGDACETIPKFVESHGHLLISLLYLDFDLHAPTKTALEHLLPRVVKGGVVAFDELNCADFPGETRALFETLSLKDVELRRMPMDPYISYFIR